MSLHFKNSPSLPHTLKSPTRLPYTLLQGLPVIVYSKLHFFPNPQVPLHIQKELHSNNLPIQQLSWKQRIFGKRDNSVLGSNYCRWYLNQASVSSKKSLKSCFSEVLMYFPNWDSDSYVFKYNLDIEGVYVFYWKRNTKFILKNLGKFFHGPWKEILWKAIFLSNNGTCCYWQVFLFISGGFEDFS